MFIPNSLKIININDTVILKEDFKVIGGIFTKGHEFVVINKYKNNNNIFFTIKDSDNYIINVGEPVISSKEDFYSCKKAISDRNILNLKLLNYKKTCEFLGYDYEKYKKYECCKKTRYKKCKS